MPFIHWVSQAFSDDGTPSSSRVIGTLAMIAVLVGYLHVCLHSHVLPDGAASAGAAALGTAPYTVNRVTSAWGKQTEKPADPKVT